jgi:predicted DNA-binding transcriptional regulator YafY
MMKKIQGGLSKLRLPPYTIRMSDKLGRYIEIDRRIRNGEKPTVKELSSLLSESERNVKRDIEAMRSELGAPIATDHKAKGYVYTDAFYMLPTLKIGFNADELFAFAIAERTLERYRGTPLHDQLQKAFARLREFIPEDQVTVNPAWLNADVTIAVEATRAVDMVAWERALEALRTRMAIRFSYKAPGKNAKTMSLETYHCLYFRGDWYLIGNDRAAAQVKNFALSRMKDLKELAEGYHIPDDFKLDDYVDAQMGLFLNDGEYRDVTIRFEADAAVYATERVWHATQTLKDLPDGRVELRFRTNQLRQTGAWIMSWGKSAEVLEPVELREIVADHVKGMGKMY